MQMNWNVGGWFGGQIGSTAWILVAAILSLFRDAGSGLVLLAVFAVPNIVGLALWRHRHKLSCYAATQLFLAAAGVCGLLTIYVLERQSLWKSIQIGSSVSALSAYVMIVLVFVFLMVMFYVRFGRDTNGPAA